MCILATIPYLFSIQKWTRLRWMEFQARLLKLPNYFGVGHTTGDIVVYFPEEKSAFIGDQVFWGRPQLIHSYKGGNSFEHLKTTKKLLSLDIEKYCSGHSEIKSRADVICHLEEFTQFQEKVKTLVENGKSLAETKAAFNQNEGRLVESVYNEIKAMN